MPLTECPECDAVVSTLAAACPRCGLPAAAAQEILAARTVAPLQVQAPPTATPMPMPTAWWEPSRGVYLAFAAVAVLWFVCSKSSQKVPDSPYASTNGPGAAAAIRVSANDLFNAYQANQVSADGNYKGKKLLVSGAVASIDTGALGGITIRLSTPNPFEFAMASMEDSEKASTARLAKGQTIKLLCLGRGVMVASPLLGNCVVSEWW